MFVSRIVRRAFGAATRSKAYSTSSEASDSAAATVSVKRTLNPLEEFFEPDRNTDEERPVTYGRGWKASELRLKSWDDLHKLWYVLLKEKNMLMTQRQMLNAQNLRFTNPERIQKEKKLKLHNELLKSHNGVFRPRNAGDNCFLRCMSTTGQPEISYKEESSIESPEAEQAQRIKFKRPDKTAKHIMNILDKEEVNKVQAEREIPDIRPGYIIQLKVEVPENKRRTSNIKGIVIARRNAGLNTTFRLRRIVAGVGIESVYPLYSPNIKEIKVLDKKRVRRAKLYYLRERMNPFKP